MLTQGEHVWHAGCFSSQTFTHALQLRKTTMNTASRTATTDADQLPKDLVELTAAVAELPAAHRGRIEAILLRVNESTRRRRRILSLVQEALSQLRLDMKYLMFDLEATRRERDALKQERGDVG